MIWSRGDEYYVRAINDQVWFSFEDWGSGPYVEYNSRLEYWLTSNGKVKVHCY